LLVVKNIEAGIVPLSHHPIRGTFQWHLYASAYGHQC
jgi:hypothetical protein